MLLLTFRLLTFRLLTFCLLTFRSFVQKPPTRGVYVPRRDPFVYNAQARLCGLCDWPARLRGWVMAC
jgi:hypothetical protein